jgi:hypothetical protein
MNPDKKESNPRKSPDAVETPVPPQHMDPSKKPMTEKKERKPGGDRKK